MPNRQFVGLCVAISFVFMMELLSCHCNSQQQTGVMHIERIDIDIFSGRPNPGWVPSGGDNVWRVDYLSATNEITCSGLPDALGYKGFICTLRPDSAGAAPEMVRIYRDTIWHLGAVTRCYKDSHRLESFMISQAKEHGFAQLLTSLGM